MPPEEVTNCVKALYAPFTDAMISDKIAALLKTDIKSELQIIFQPIANLHQACPDNLETGIFRATIHTRRKSNGESRLYEFLRREEGTRY